MKRPETKDTAGLDLQSQEQLLPFLLNPKSYAHRPRSVRLVQTHASFVFLTPPFVFKVKKPVNFGFLDFSTLEKRRHFCEREVSLNRRLAPTVYLGVVPISARGGQFAFGEGEQVVEYAVKMRILSERHFLDQRLRRGEVAPEDLDRLAVVLRDFYLNQRPTEEIESWGRIDRLRISTDENFRQAEPFVSAPVESLRPEDQKGVSNAGHSNLTRPAFETLQFYTREFYRRRSQLLKSRVREKRILDCHGDLHLEHVHLTPRTLSIFDCIEFNDRFRYVDVANDIAFLAMDLDFQGRPDLARYFAGRMATELQDEGMPLLMDFYKCYRAFVRGKVESLHCLAPTAPEEERRVAAERARRYFRLALQYTVAGSHPLVLAVMGRIASGKTTLAQALGAELGWEVYSSDYVRKKLAGFPLFERSSAAARIRLYSREMTEHTYDRLLTSAAIQVQKGQPVILDATFAQRALRERLAERFGRRGVAWCVVEAQASDAAVRRRLSARETKADEISDARREDYAMLTRLYEPPVELPLEHYVRVRTTNRLDATVTKALQSLACLQVKASGNAP
ncbi:MAG TPA: AAA family ATPase [Verrucomicrobiota bacterium]|nr:AAA family ATPase [Verrucomicrobiota bacterium]